MTLMKDEGRGGGGGAVMANHTPHKACQPGVCFAFRVAPCDRHGGLKSSCLATSHQSTSHKSTKLSLILAHSDLPAACHPGFLAETFSSPSS
jgi:hypothetical protein